jgi:hypothetical protein
MGFSHSSSQLQPAEDFSHLRLGLRRNLKVVRVGGVSKTPRHPSPEAQVQRVGPDALVNKRRDYALHQRSVAVRHWADRGEEQRQLWVGVVRDNFLSKGDVLRDPCRLVVRPTAVCTCPHR